MLVSGPLFFDHCDRLLLSHKVSDAQNHLLSFPSFSSVPHVRIVSQSPDGFGRVLG